MAQDKADEPIPDRHAVEGSSADDLRRMLGDICLRIERGYDATMITTVKGLSDWWRREKARQKATQGLSARQEEELQNAYQRLAWMKLTDPFGLEDD